jgi:hypothetical protein
MGVFRVATIAALLVIVASADAAAKPKPPKDHKIKDSRVIGSGSSQPSIVPEPGTLTLLGTGIGGLVVRALRRRRRTRG